MPTTQASPIEVDEDVASEPSEPTPPLLERLDAVGQQVGTFVRERPLAAVGIALFAGFLIGRLARR